MQQKSLARTVNASSATRPLCLLLILVVFIALAGCSSNQVTAGQDGISIQGGQWTGKSDDGSFSMQFRIGTDGANVFIDTLSYPCGEKTASVLPPHSIKAALNNSAFESSTKDYSDLLPKLVVTGKFIDSTHAQGTWEFFGYSDEFMDLYCPVASGSWTGSPGE